MKYLAISFVYLVLAIGNSAAESPDVSASKRARRLEVGGAPILGGSSDLGFAFGGIGSLARFDPRFKPFRWRLELFTLSSVKPDDQGDAGINYQDHFAELDLPGLAGGRLRMRFKVAFGRHSNIGYYGIGNASVRDPNRPSRYYQYDRMFPEVRTRARIRISDGWSLTAGLSFVYNRIAVDKDSKLAEDLASGDAALVSQLKGLTNHTTLTGEFGLIYDTRDHEFVPSKGVFHEVSWRVFPATELAYGGFNIGLRFFHPLYKKKLVFAGRLMFDALFGGAPLYELARHGGGESRAAPGGENAIRGVPAQRYHGKIKAIGNVELRATLLSFRLLAQRFALGATAFFDAGRVWTDAKNGRRLDGDGFDYKWGTGAGLRLLWGETFLIRTDVAYSPDADPIAFYITAKHAF